MGFDDAWAPTCIVAEQMREISRMRGSKINQFVFFQFAIGTISTRKELHGSIILCDCFAYACFRYKSTLIMQRTLGGVAAEMYIHLMAFSKHHQLAHFVKHPSPL